MESPARDKRSSLFGLFISYEKNKLVFATEMTCQRKMFLLIWRIRKL
jgi:hypothetical protein